MNSPIPSDSLQPDQTTEENVVDFGNVRTKKAPDTIASWLKRIIGYYPRSGNIPLEAKDRTKAITRDGQVHLKSFLDHVPFTHYDTAHKQITNADSDRERRAVFLDILPADVEGMSNTDIEGIAEKIKIAFGALPGLSNPWIVQIYLNDEPVRALTHEIRAYARSCDNGKHTNELPPLAFRDAWEAVLDEHLKTISNRRGIFTEQKTGMQWRARYRRVRMIIYRNSIQVDPDELNETVLRLTESLKEAGIHSRRMDGEAVYKWLMPWYSGEREAAYTFMEDVPYPLAEEQCNELPAAFDLGELCLRNRSVRCDKTNQCWQLGNRYYRFITLEPYQRKPAPGHWVLETQSGATPFDRMPDGSILNYTLIIEPQDKVEAGIETIKGRAIGDGQDARLTQVECDDALTSMAQGDRLISALAGITIDAGSIDELNERTTQCIAAARGAGFDVIEPTGEHGDALILDTFVRALPMNFDPLLDKKYRKRARKLFDDHAARLIPFLTRGRGTNHHGINFNATGGEPISFDPLSNLDRAQNAHLFMIGPTGSGKTTTTIAMLLQMLYTHNPRMYLITSLPTFYLLSDYLEHHGFKVNKIQVTKQSQPSMPPFADITLIETGSDRDPNNTRINDAGDRNILGEAEIVAKLMLTSGREAELSSYDSHAEALVSQAILFAAKTVAAEGRHEALTEDIVTAFKALARDTEKYPTDKEREMLAKYGTIMERYTTGMKGQLFNRPRDKAVDADVTIIELGDLAKVGNETDLAIAMAGQLQAINHVVEDDRGNLRNTITVIDEAHTLIKNPLISPYLKKITAMWRTYAGWLWIITQSLEQIPNEAKELLNQPEWWFALNMDRDELSRIKKFRDLNPHQELLLTKTRKEFRKFTEGGVISSNVNTIFRVVPPPITLALTGTENLEIAERHALMKQHNISELEAVYMKERDIQKAREEFTT